MAQANKTFASSAALQGANGLKQRHFVNLLENNDLGIVDNPLLYRDSDGLKKDVTEFYHRHRLELVIDFELLLRGARFAQDDVLFRESGNLSSVESEAILKEENPRLKDQSRALNTIILTCCIAAVIQGWSQASITGANLQWPYAFGVSSDDNPYQPKDRRNYWIFGGVNAITSFAAGSIGCWLSDPLNEYLLGRRGALFIAGILTFAASIGSAFTYSWQALFVCRLLLGIGYGAKASVVPIFESEVCPPKSRGRLLVSWQTFTAVGIMLGSAANLVFHGPHHLPANGSNDGWREQVAWRLQVASCAIPAIPLLCLTFLCSESPRWLAKQDRYRDAFRVLRSLRETPLQAARDLYYIYAQLRVETLLFSKDPATERQLEDWSDDTIYDREAKRSTYWARVLQLFTVSRNGRASLAAAIVMASQQLSGINVFAFLATTIFNGATCPTKAGGTRITTGGQEINPMKSLWLAFGFAVANAVFSPVAYWIIDSKGRRFLLLASLMAMVPLLLATGFSFTIKDIAAQNVVAEIFLILYTAAYSPGAGVVPFLYSSEVFPLINREAGMSLACSVNFILAGVLALTVPLLNNALCRTYLLCLFAGLDAMAVILVWLFVPGTVQVTTLEEMNYIFGVPTASHVHYQVTKSFPWTFRHYTPGLTAGQLKPLYTWNRERITRELDTFPTHAGHLDHEELSTSPMLLDGTHHELVANELNHEISAHRSPV